MPRLKIFFSYDGNRYKGFQRQKNTSFTIQEALENKLSTICNARISILASGRTDAGVHARIQVAHADVPESRASSPDRLAKGLNSILPRDIRVARIEAAPHEFHAIRDSKRKTYLYFIDPSPVQWPALRHYAWHLRLPLDWKAMDEGARFLKGRHDFRAFCGSGSTAKTTIRTVFEARWGDVPCQGLLDTRLRAFRITGSGFLKNMVRGIVGTLVHIGGGKASPELIREVLESGDRKSTGPTAPARGLWLWDVQY